ncbi:MAG: gamma-glutamyltransferase family protein, partial [Candidatus Sumerlaeota bacterium]|nr:gamma-glutamyltransferase family protein [Candidatus Sumerlaeota bacterium]
MTEFISRRSPVYAARGMVAASQPLAVQAGLAILERGGNAADAAAATAAALGVTEPMSTGLGGDCFALYYQGATGVVAALNSSGRSPAALTLDRVQREGHSDALPPRHPYAVTVPGTCAGWFALRERFGSLGMAAVLAPAIRLADEGFPVAPLAARSWEANARMLMESNPAPCDLLPGGRAPRAGEIVRNAALAASLRAIAEGGPDAFYRGPIAEAIVAALQSRGGAMTLDDLAEHAATWEEPISAVYRGVRIHECAPNGQGLAALIALNILSCVDLGALGAPMSAPRLHYEIEAMRLALADARRHVADPAFYSIPLKDLLSPAYADARARRIDPQAANHEHGPGLLGGADTVYFTVADSFGNICSFVNSNSKPFGTGIVPPGLGFALQNRGCFFSLDPGHPNALAPRKRPYHTIIAGMATRESDGSVYGGFGVMGGLMQPQGHAQVVLALLEDGLDPQSALDRPRHYLQTGRPDSDVLLEEGIAQETAADLAARGH